MSSALRLVLVLIGLVLLPLISAAEDDPAREVLRQQAPPWYDAAADDWRRLEVKAPEPETVREGSGDSTFLDALGGLFSWLMVILVVAVTAWLIWMLVRNFAVERGAPVGEERRAAVARAVADLSALPFADAQSAKDPEAALDRAIAERDWRRAVAWSYALHLVELDHAGALRVNKGTTNRGYLRMLATWAGERAARQGVPALLSDAVDTFERTWFGHHPADQALVQGLELGRLRLHEQLTQERPA